MNAKGVSEHIVSWMSDYLENAGSKGFVVGISGGIDSAVVSTLAAMTGHKTLCVTLPIHQARSHMVRAEEHIECLRSKFPNVSYVNADLTDTYDTFEKAFSAYSLDGVKENVIELAGANSRSRLRMTALFYYAGLYGMLVAGTGNKIEDFGVGFFTKYGDGGVDISPIGDITKTEVFELGKWLGVPESIINAAPTDGLFGDDRSDEEQIGATYPELEWAMEQVEKGVPAENFTGREREVYDIYVSRNRANRHKMTPIPVCTIPEDLK